MTLKKQSNSTILISNLTKQDALKLAPSETNQALIPLPIPLSNQVKNDTILLPNQAQIQAETAPKEILENSSSFLSDYFQGLGTSVKNIRHTTPKSIRSALSSLSKPVKAFSKVESIWKKKWKENHAKALGELTGYAVPVVAIPLLLRSRMNGARKLNENAAEMHNAEFESGLQGKFKKLKTNLKMLQMVIWRIQFLKCKPII